MCLSNIGIALKLSALVVMLVAMLASSGGASYYGDHDRHSYLGNANIDRSIVKPAEINPLTQINSSGIFIHYQDPYTMNVWEYLQQYMPKTAFSPENEQDAHYDDTLYA